MLFRAVKEGTTVNKVRRGKARGSGGANASFDRQLSPRLQLTEVRIANTAPNQVASSIFAITTHTCVIPGSIPEAISNSCHCGAQPLRRKVCPALTSTGPVSEPWGSFVKEPPPISLHAAFLWSNTSHPAEPKLQLIAT